MLTTLLLAGAMMVDGAAQPVTVEARTNSFNVGYEALMRGDNTYAVQQIQENHGLATDDPAALINLGTAYARLGKVRSARSCFQAAILTDERYDLELADGSWMDSRAAARLAVERLDSGSVLALK